MARRKTDIDNDWEITMPFGLLEMFIFLLVTAYTIRPPEFALDLIPNSALDYAKTVALFGILLFNMITALMRIRQKRVEGPFLVLDYAIIGSGIMFFMATGIALASQL
ncbi:MAG: hypothetical protein ACO1O1_13250 [Adhaeribacter sp.]